MKIQRSIAVLLLLIMFCQACATTYDPGDGVLIASNDQRFVVGKTDDPLTELALKLMSAHRSNNYEGIIEACRAFKPRSTLEGLYVTNIEADMLTNYQVDLQQAMELNKGLVQTSRQFDPSLKIDFNSDYTEMVYMSGATRTANALPLIVGGLLAIPFSLFGGDKAKEDLGTIWGEGVMKGAYPPQSASLEREDVVKKYFFINVEAIRAAACERLANIYDQIGDTEEAQKWAGQK